MSPMRKIAEYASEHDYNGKNYYQHKIDDDNKEMGSADEESEY